LEKLLYVMLIERGKTYNKINKAMVVKHVDFVKNADRSVVLKVWQV